MDTGMGKGRPVGPRGIARRLGGSDAPTFSLCIMVTDWAEYDACIASLADHGFDAQRCEFIVVDNSAGNAADAYVAGNEFLQAAQGRWIVLCHHDILLLDHDIDTLGACLDELEALDPTWGICGNAGYAADGWPEVNVSSGGRAYISGGPYPARVVSVDENFMVVRRAANLALSRDLTGFHHYGPDLCIVADILGWSAYVIDFHLHHKSSGTVDDRYFASRDRIAAKYRRAFRPRWIHLVTMRPFLLSGWRAHHRVARAQQWLGKLVGVYPRGAHLQDPARQAARHARRTRAR